MPAARSGPAQLSLAVLLSAVQTPWALHWHFQTTTSPRTKLYLSTSRCSSWSCLPLFATCGLLWQQAIAMLQMREGGWPQTQAGRLSAHLVSYLLVPFINSNSKSPADCGFGQQSVISVYPSTDCQEPALSQYKVCCNTVSWSNFPPELFLRRGWLQRGKPGSFAGPCCTGLCFFTLIPRWGSLRFLVSWRGGKVFYSSIYPAQNWSPDSPLDLCSCRKQNFKSHPHRNFRRVTSVSKINHHNVGLSHIQNLVIWCQSSVFVSTESHQPESC